MLWLQQISSGRHVAEFKGGHEANLDPAKGHVCFKAHWFRWYLCLRAMIARRFGRWRIGRPAAAGFLEMRIVPRNGHSTLGNAAAERSRQMAQSRMHGTGADRGTPGFAIRSIPTIVHLIQIVPWR
jgi:hypothetical protein